VRDRHEGAGPDAVAITGLGVMAPGAATTQEFWQLLCSGRSSARPLDHLIEAGLPVTFGCAVAQSGTDLVRPAAARRQDRMTQLAMAAGTAAYEDAKLAGPAEADRAGILVGNGMGGLARLHEEYPRLLQGKYVHPLTIPLIMPNAVAANLAMELGWTGPALTVSSACVSGLYALGEAAQMISSGELDVVLAGGTEAPLSPFTMAGFARLQALSVRNDAPDAASRPFDRDRDGFVMGEGAAFCLLERLDRALDRGASPYAVIAGFGRNSDAFHLVAPREDGAGAATCMRMALRSAQASPDEIVHIQAHGTSTPANDSAEARAINLVFGDRPPPVTSVKGAVGHLIGAAGAVSCVACCLALRHGQVPPTANYSAGDPDSRLDVVHGEPRPVRPGPVLINAFAFGGHNGSLVIKPVT
jgi:3-oxoacyl-[acyl-carrier-protein] synthase II